MKEDRSVLNRSTWTRVLMILLFICLPILAGCDRNRTAETGQLDLGELRRQRENIGAVTDADEPGDTSAPTTTTPPPPVTEVTTTPAPTPVTEATTTPAPPPVTEATTTPAPPPVTDPTTTPAPVQEGEATISVMFDSMGGTEVPTQTIRPGTPAQKPEDPVREGYEFTGWYLSGMGIEHDFNNSIWVNYNLDAGWVEASTATTDANLQAPPTDPEPTASVPADATPVVTDPQVEEPTVEEPTAEDPPTDDPAGQTGPARVEVKPELKPAFAAQTEDDQVVTSYVSRFIDYSGIQGTILLPPFDYIGAIPSNWIVNYYLDDFYANGQTTVLLGDIEARAREEMNPDVTLDPATDYGTGYDPATATFDLSNGLPNLGPGLADTRITQTYINQDGSRTVEVTEFQYLPLSGRSNAGLITAQDRIVGYYDTNFAGDANPNGDFYFPEAQIIAQAQYHLIPNSEGAYYLHSKTWNSGMSEGLPGVMNMSEMTGVVNTGGANLNVRAYADTESEQVGSISDGTTLQIFSPPINNMYIAFSLDGSFPPGYVSADYVTLNQ